MRLTLIVTTYNRPDALHAVLGSALAQRELPQQIIVADDGSDDATRSVIDRARAAPGADVRHVWQPHADFRAARLRNLAIAAASGDYLVIVDGDMVLHREFIADHRRIARRGHFTQGVRLLLDDERTASVLREPLQSISASSPGLGGLRRLYAFHHAPLSRALSHLANHVIALKSCNQGFWRDDLIRVNGFNEDFVGWGPEDKELCARLQYSGVRRQTLVCGGIAYHLKHAPAARDRFAINTGILATTMATRAMRCERGVDAHLTNHLP